MSDSVEVQQMGDLVNATKNVQQILAKIQSTLSTVFPQATGTSTTVATSGTVSLPSAEGFIEVYVPTLSKTVKVPYYEG